MAIPFNQIAFPNTVAESMLKRLASGDIKFPHGNTTGILLYGDIGNGKSAATESFVEEMQKNLDPNLPHNANVKHLISPDNGVALINNLKQQFSYFSQGTYHYQIINEIDNLAPQAMTQFKSVMDSLAGHVVWIFTSNHYKKIDAGLVGRCYAVDYDPFGPQAWLPFIQQELSKRHITMNNNQIISKIVVPGGNNLRGIIREIEAI